MSSVEENLESNSSRKCLEYLGYRIPIFTYGENNIGPCALASGSSITLDGQNLFNKSSTTMVVVYNGCDLELACLGVAADFPSFSE